MKNLKFLSILILTFSLTGVIYAEKTEKTDKTDKIEKTDKTEKKDNSCKKKCGKALNDCNTGTSKIDKKEKAERKKSHEKCQAEFTSCKAACND